MSGTKRTPARKRTSVASAEKVARADRSPRSPRGTSAGAAPSHQDIERRAYEIFLRDGRHGHALEHWLQAERELRLRR